MSKFWIGVVSKEHVLRGVEIGIAQVCHGKKAPLAKLFKGDYLIYYSPKEMFKGNIKCQKFTAIGKVSSGEVYQVKMTDAFFPYRLDISYFPSKDVSIYDLKKLLSFMQSSSWGMLFRRGLFEITENDFKIIANAMGVNFDE